MHNIGLVVQKELRVLFCTIRGYLLLFVIGGCIFSALNLPFLIAYVPVLLTYVVISTPAAYEERYQGGYLNRTLPVQGSDIVTGKYATVFVFLLGTMALWTVLNLINLAITGNPSRVLAVILVTTLAAAFVSAVMIPLIYRDGVTKSRVKLLVIYALFFVAAAILVNVYEELSFQIPAVNVSLPLLAVAGTVFVAVFVFGSYKLSLKYYNEKRPF